MTWLWIFGGAALALSVLVFAAVRIGRERDPLARLGRVDAHREIRPDDSRER